MCGAKNDTSKTNLPARTVYLKEYFLGTPTENVIRIKDACGKNKEYWINLFRVARHAMINCSHLDLKLDLINEIARLGGSFLALHVNPPDGATLVGSEHHSHYSPPALTYRGTSACWEGSGYVSWRAYPTFEDAVSYLKIYFVLKACSGNLKCTQRFKDSKIH